MTGLAQHRNGTRLGFLAVLLVVLTLGAAWLAVQVDTRPAQGSTCSLESTGGIVSRTIGGREYLLKVPDGLTGEVPLLVALHGLTHGPEDIIDYAPWEDLSDSRGYVIAYPRGNGETWDLHQNSVDVTFLRDVVADIESVYCIDSARVHITGDSMGGYMAQRMACDASDVFASVAEYAGGPPDVLGSGPCTPSRDIAVAMFHGTNDRLVRIGLGRMSRDAWAVRLGCGSPSTQSLWDGLLLTYSCGSGTELQWREYNGTGHMTTWQLKGTDLSLRQLDFFAAHPHPTR